MSILSILKSHALRACSLIAKNRHSYRRERTIQGLGNQYSPDPSWVKQTSMIINVKDCHNAHPVIGFGAFENQEHMNFMIRRLEERQYLMA